MQQPSRRTLLAGTGTALALGAAGWLERVQSSDQPADSQADSLPAGLEDTFQYVYAPSDGGTVFRIARVTENPQETPGGYHPRILELGEPEWIVVAGALSGERGFVATGSFEVDADEERFQAEGSRDGFDLYRVGQADEDERDDERERLATDGETVLLGEPEWVTTILDRSASNESTYLESTEGARALLSVVDFSGQATLVDDEEEIRKPFEDVDVEPTTLPDRLLAHFAQGDDTISYTLAGWYADLPGDGPAETLSSFLTQQVDIEDVSTDVREAENVVVARGTRPYTPPDERPDTAGHPRFHGYDAETGEVLFRFDRGEQLAIEHFDIEIEDEVYDGDWARGQDEIGEGSIIGIDADAIEPGDHISVTYESPDGSYSSSSGTTALRRLPFEIDFDPDERTAEVRYAEGPPLDADRVSVVVDHGEGEETTRQPWSGELESGDAATLSALPIEGYLVVRYERSDGGQVRIGGGSFDPPGRFTFDYDGRSETMTIRYPEPPVDADRPSHPARRDRPDREPLDADRFEITVDGEPTERQWSDRGGEIAPGATMAITEVPVGTEVAVAWIGEDGTRHDVASTHTVPTLEFEFSYDAAADELTVTHAGGQAADAEKLDVRLHGEESRTVDWGEDGNVSEGDEVVLEEVPEHSFAVVTYADSHLDHVHVMELREDDDE